MRNASLWVLGMTAGLAALPVSAMNGSRAMPGGGIPAVMHQNAATVAAPVSVPRVATLNEGFDDVGTLVGNGWVRRHLSAPTGTVPGWFQGNPTLNAQTGAANSYVAANFQSTAGGTGTISDWLITPELEFGRDASFTFWTRKAYVAGGADYPDRLEVRLSANGASSDAGSTHTSTGDFSTVLLSINPTQVAGGYPYTWTQYTLTHAHGVPRNGSGRIAFRYFVTQAGPSGTNSEYIGVDTVSYSAGVPQYPVFYTIVGLQGDAVGLSLNGGVPIAHSYNGSFVFPEYVDDGSPYSVTVTSQPSHPKQTCVTGPATGTVNGADIVVVILCTTDPFVLTVEDGFDQQAMVNEMFADELVAMLVDSDGDPVPGAQVTFESPLSGQSAWLHDLNAGPATTLVTTTDAHGYVVVSAQANGIVGCYGVIASHPNAGPVAFRLTNIWYPAIFADGFETSPEAVRGLNVCDSKEVRPPLR
jgi:hypothetical protein